MKIAIAVGRFPLISETFVLNITTRLLERGHDVTVLALNGAAPEGMPAHPDVDRYDVMDRVVLGRRMPKTTVARWLSIGRLRGSLPVLARGLNPFAFGLDALSLKILHNAAAITQFVQCRESGQRRSGIRRMPRPQAVRVSSWRKSAKVALVWKVIATAPRVMMSPACTATGLLGAMRSPLT